MPNNDEKKLKEAETLMQKLSNSFKTQMSQAAKSFSQMFSVNSAVTLLISKTKAAISELKEIDTLLAEINEAGGRLSKSASAKLRNDSFEVASKYGKKSTDYLSGVKDAALAGYKNPEKIAELSLAAQTAGDMTAQLSNQLILAMDNAYQMNGSIAGLTKALDGMNFITNHNTVNMTELSESMALISSTASSSGVGIGEAAAALGTMLATTHQSGSETAKAFQTILLYLRQVADEAEGIDAGGLARYENACKALNVQLKETKNGVLSLRNPMEVLRDLSVAYNKLSDSDSRKTELLSSIGSNSGATQLDALLRQWSTYETMLAQYANGTGSMARDAEKTAASWEGSLNRLENTWKDTIENIVRSEGVTTILNGLNSLLSVINKITDALGPLASIGLGAGLVAGFKNVGSPKMSGPIIVLNLPTVC